jgi:hypothetical protein
MRHKNLSFEKLQELLNFYQQQPINILKQIEPKWAYGKHKNKIQDLGLNDKKRYIFFLASPSEIVLNAEFGGFDITPLFTGDWNNDSRITRILYAWKNNYYVDPPVIWLNGSSEKKLSFSDGRHRTKLSFHLEYAQIPIVIERTEFDEISSVVQLTMV